MIGPKELLKKTLDDLKVDLDNNTQRIDALEDVIDGAIKEGKELEEAVKAYQRFFDKYDEVQVDSPTLAEVVNVIPT